MTEDRELPREWCVVANVAHETRHGPGGEQVQAGLRHFAPGARLWVMPLRFANEDERLEVIGVHRGRGGRQIVAHVLRRHLENFRIRAVHSPAVLRAKDRSNQGWSRAWCCPELTQPWVDRWNALAVGEPDAGFPPWPARPIFGSDARPCPHRGE